MQRRRRKFKFQPCLECIEAKQLLSGGALGAAVSVHKDESVAAVETNHKPHRFYGYRITNPKIYNVNLFPPFQQVLVQKQQPVPGHVYNIMSIAVKNATAQTFTASNNFVVRMTNQPKSESFPVLTGNQVWKPNTWFVFYVLTKKYYAVDFVAGGFQFDLGGASTTLVPGPSAIFLRLKYNPAKFKRTLDWIMAYGQGAQTGNGPPVGMPDTAINQIVGGKTLRIDYGGHF